MGRFNFRWPIGSGCANDCPMTARAAFLAFAFFLEAPLSIFANGGAF